MQARGFLEAYISVYDDCVDKCFSQKGYLTFGRICPPAGQGGQALRKFTRRFHESDNTADNANNLHGLLVKIPAQLGPANVVKRFGGTCTGFVVTLSTSDYPMQPRAASIPYVPNACKTTLS